MKASKMVFNLIKLLWSSVILTLCAASAVKSHDLNVVFILADDLGWNDIGYHNPDIFSPNIDKLANEGVILNQSYAQPLCSPSRSAFMTGVYPFRLGLQHEVIMPATNVCVPFDRPFVSEIFQRAGYATHAVGKWHLGYCNVNCTPTHRGFHSFYGYFNGNEDHYTKITQNFHAYDFHDNQTLDRSVYGLYSGYLFRERIKKIITEHDTSKPLFLYLPFQNVHWPIQVPKQYYDMYPNVENKNRRTLMGMVTALDDSVGLVIDSLKAKGLYDNTLIVFSADNGGPVLYGASNIPLRGSKETLFEGGTRVTGFVHGPMFKTTGVKYDGMIHFVDWFPTLVDAAGIGYKGVDQDGVSQWQSLLTLSVPSKRQEMVYNLDSCKEVGSCEGVAAIRYGDYKLIDGYPGNLTGWYPPAEMQDDIGSQISQVNLVEDENTSKNRYLFNLKDDPNERVNLYNRYPEIVKSLKERLEAQRKREVPANYPPSDPKGDPKLYGNALVTGWC